MARKLKEKEALQCQGLSFLMARRQFLFMGAATLGTVTLATVLPGRLLTARVAAYEGKKIGTLSGLRLGEPQEFFYPYDHPLCHSFLFRLGTEAGGGVGPGRDIVAFNSICPHQGGPLAGRYNSTHQVLGPCPLHLTTFDLTRHGMVVSGHATQGLPQITLEVRGDDIYATGVLGLIYGLYDNEVAPS